MDNSNKTPQTKTKTLKHKQPNEQNTYKNNEQVDHNIAHTS